MALNNFEPNVMGGMPGFSGFGAGFGGIAPVGLIGLDSLGRRGHGDDCCDDGRKDTWQGISTLKDSIAEAKDALNERLSNAEGRLFSAAHASEVRDLESRFLLANRIGDLERGAQERFFQLQTKGLENTIAIKDQICEFEHHVDHEFCTIRKEISDSTRLVLERLTQDKLDDKNDEIANLRRERDGINQQLLFSNQFNAMNSIIANLSNEQKLTNKIVQLGAGNTAIPVAANTQVK